MKPLNFGLPQITISVGSKCLDFHVIMSRVATILALIGTGGAFVHLVPANYAEAADVLVAVYNALVPSVLTPAGITREIIPTTSVVSLAAPAALSAPAAAPNVTPDAIPDNAPVSDTPALEESGPSW